MKILFVEQLGKNNWEYIYSAAKYIAREHDVTCYMSDTTPIKTEQYNFSIVYGFKKAYEGNFVNKAIHYLKALVELCKFIKNGQFDIVHLEWFSLPWVEWLFVRYMKKYSKIVITVNDVIPFETRYLEMKALETIYRSADAILVHTQETLDLFNATYKTKCVKGIITPAFREKSDYHKIEKITARKELGIPNNKTVILFFGTIRRSKGLDILVKGFAKAYQENTDLFLLGAGAFHSVNQEEYKNLITQNLNLENSKFDFEHIDDNLLPYYFSSADILCVPYRNIYQSGIAQLGLIYDLPILGSNIPRLSNMVRDNINGRVFKSEDSDDLANVLLEMCKDKIKLKQYSNQSKEISQEEFSVEKRAKKTMEIYKQVLKTNLYV